MTLQLFFVTNGSLSTEHRHNFSQLNHTTKMKRREFIKSSIASVAMLSVPSALASTAPATKKPKHKNSTIKHPAKADDFNVSMAGYTFVNFSLADTLKFMQSLDVHYLCIKDFHLPLNSTDQQIADFHRMLSDANVVGYAVGPIYMKSTQEVDRAFNYAKRVGVKMIVGVPNYELLDYVEQKVKETDIRLAIHMHGPDMPIYPDASDVWNNVKHRDARMGMCLDIGHNLRYGSDSIADLKRYSSRVFDIHLKDVTAPTKEGHAIELGRGIIDFPDFVKTLRKVGYKGALSLEYEKNMRNPFTEIAESIGYFRAVLHTTR
uniref:Putative xylose isomerase n=1 Tax=uncultured Proteiniphilum sp. TaxID=497637 RepID=A0A649UYR4_9BACT|nr:putative xylose isomerase [uncultured Proteiniphilum sp.]